MIIKISDNFLVYIESNKLSSQPSSRIHIGKLHNYIFTLGVIIYHKISYTSLISHLYYHIYVFKYKSPTGTIPSMDTPHPHPQGTRLTVNNKEAEI